MRSCRRLRECRKVPESCFHPGEEPFAIGPVSLAQGPDALDDLLAHGLAMLFGDPHTIVG